MSNFLLNTKLRRAFLRGIFAAEGTVGINDAENYIVYVQFCLHHDEDEIAALIEHALKLENISYITKKQLRDHSLGIRMTGWQNYAKLWQIGIFNLNERKKRRFFEKVRKTKFNFKLKRFLIRRLLDCGVSHRQLALSIGVDPAMLCNLHTGKTSYLNISELFKLKARSGTSMTEIKNGIVTTRINRVTEIRDPSFAILVLSTYASALSNAQSL